MDLRVTAIRLLIAYHAVMYGVDVSLATEICRLESDFDSRVFGDEGEAAGLYQWHLDSWIHVRAMMGASTEDTRMDPIDNIATAMYAMGELKLYRWWSTYEIACQHVGMPATYRRAD